MPGPMAQAVILGGRGRRIRNLKIPWATECSRLVWTTQTITKK